MAWIKCKKCGKRLSEMCITCPKCGANIQNQILEGLSPQEQQAIIERHRRITVKLWVVSIVLFIATILVPLIIMKIEYGDDTWAGTWVSDSNQWHFILYSSGSADAKVGPFEYVTKWTKEEEDDYAVIGGAGDTRAFMLYRNGELYAYSNERGEIYNTGIKLKKR